MSLAVKVYGVPRYAFTVPRGAFVPAPNVDSAVLVISDIHNPFPDPESERWFFTILRAGFAHKRKRLQKNLEEVADKQAVMRVFSEKGIDVNVRPETVPLATWGALAASLTPA